MDSKFKSHLLKKPSKRSPASTYQRFLDQFNEDSESARQENFTAFCVENENDSEEANAAGCRRSLFSFDISGLDEFEASFEQDGSDGLEAIVGDLDASVFGSAASSSEEGETEEDIIFWLKKALPALAEAGLLGDLKLFFKLIADDAFPLSNIALLLFLDVVRFYGCANVCGMRYRKQTLLFWIFGYLLFHGKWLRFNRGLKFSGSTLSGDVGSRRGHFNPEECSINFAVPADSVIRKSLEKQASVPRQLQSGVITPILVCFSRFT